LKAPVIDRETAEKEVNAWLESKKCFPSEIEKNKDSVEILVEAIMYGTLTLNETEKTFTHQLLFPLGEDGATVTELTYKHRINDKMVQRYMKGVSATDGEGRLNATIGCLTETARGIIEGLDTKDKRIANAIAIFFF
jgi:hypothetical protein